MGSLQITQMNDTLLSQYVPLFVSIMPFKYLTISHYVLFTSQYIHEVYQITKLLFGDGSWHPFMVILMTIHCWDYHIYGVNWLPNFE